MKTGRLCADLHTQVGWEGFPEYVKEFLKVFSGRVMSRYDSVDTRLWEILLEGEKLRLVYEDFPVMICLESISSNGDGFIRRLEVMVGNRGV
ncbi:DUF3630 family protein [Pseudomonas wadenswilerensis]